MRALGALGIVALALTGCMGREDTGVVAARMETQDHATCSQRASGPAYQQCRSNLIAYRQQANAEAARSDAQRQAQGDALMEAGQAMQRLDNSPQRVDMTVHCVGCR